MFISRLQAWKDFVEAAYAEGNRTKLREVVESLEKTKEGTASPMANLLESRIRSAIDDFGQSVTANDIKVVLVEILKNLEGDK